VTRAGRRRVGERGSAVVEFALVLPIVLLVLLAVVQVGALARDRLLLTQAARAGAREAAILADDAATISAVRAAAAALDPSRLTVAVARTGTRGSPVSVHVTYEERIVGALAGWLLPSTVMLAGDATSRQEFGPS
jgi:Flp pilus assembly protein TadG